MKELYPIPPLEIRLTLARELYDTRFTYSDARMFTAIGFLLEEYLEDPLQDTVEDTICTLANTILKLIDIGRNLFYYNDKCTVTPYIGYNKADEIGMHTVDYKYKYKISTSVLSLDRLLNGKARFDMFIKTNPDIDEKAAYVAREAAMSDYECNIETAEEYLYEFSHHVRELYGLLSDTLK